MKKFSIALAFAAASALAVTSAQAGTYGEVSSGQYQERLGGVTVSQTLVRGIVGVDVTKNVAVEAHLATGVGDTTASWSGAKETLPDTGIRQSFGVFAKYTFPVTSDFEVFGRVGAIHTNMKFFGTDSSSTNGAVGAGASYAFTKKVAATIDYTRYTDNSGARPTTIMAGVNYKF